MEYYDYIKKNGQSEKKENRKQKDFFCIVELVLFWLPLLYRDTSQTPINYWVFKTQSTFIFCEHKKNEYNNPKKNMHAYRKCIAVQPLLVLRWLYPSFSQFEKYNVTFLSYNMVSFVIKIETEPRKYWEEEAQWQFYIFDNKK